MKVTVGVNVGHDAGVAVLDYTESREGKLTVYEAERFSKVKHQALFPINTIRPIILENKGVVNLSKDNFAICCYAVGPKKKENDFIKFRNYTELLNSLNAQNFSILTNPEITELSHHLCHAYSALFFSPFEKSIIIVADGIGSNGDAYNSCINDNENDDPKHSSANEKNFESVSIYLQDGGTLKLIDKVWGIYRPWLNKEVFLNDGLGSYFAAASNYIFGSWAEAGKVMGLSAYSNAQEVPEDIVKYLEEEFQKPRELFKGKEAFDNQPKENFDRSATISKRLQLYFEDYLINLSKDLAQKNPEYRNIIFAGGCALNCLTTTKLVNLNVFDSVYVPPCPNDEGISIGAAFYKALKLGYAKFEPKNIDAPIAYLGSRTIETELQDEKRINEVFKEFEIEYCLDPTLKAASLIAEGEVIAWFQGRSECGPRALGNRSILSLPSIPERKKFLNDHIKFRESFRPYGCSVTFEDTHRYFEAPQSYHMPFMSFAPKIRTEFKDQLQAVTHLDGTCRIQTVTKNQNERYYNLIKEVEKLTGHPLLLNTSLNVMGQPILENLKDAHLFLSTSNTRHLFVGNYYIRKR